MRGWFDCWLPWFNGTSYNQEQGRSEILAPLPASVGTRSETDVYTDLHPLGQPKSNGGRGGENEIVFLFQISPIIFRFSRIITKILGLKRSQSRMSLIFSGNKKEEREKIACSHVHTKYTCPDWLGSVHVHDMYMTCT